MKILDVNDVELSEEEVDFELGYLEPDKAFVQHHDAEPEQEREFYYAVRTFYFQDDTHYRVEDEDDPHIVKTDIYRGLFDYQSLDGEEPKEVRGIDLYEVETKPYAPAKEEWDEYEDFYRYILYTEEELEARAATKEKEERQADFMENGPGRLETAEENITDTSATVEDLILIMADIVGGEEMIEE